MNINELYPSKYIKADDLAGQQAQVTIMSVTVEEIADKEHKPVMRFMGKEKGMVLNKTNAINCASVWGDDTVTWQGQKATLLAAPVMFQGKQVMGLQLLPKLPQQQQQQPGGFGHPGTGNPQQNAQVQGGQSYQQQDAQYQQQFQKPGPHDGQRIRPNPATTAMDSALDNLETDINQAQQNVANRSAAAQQQQQQQAGTVEDYDSLDEIPF
jgi:hypothetical protein